MSDLFACSSSPQELAGRPTTELEQRLDVREINDIEGHSSVGIHWGNPREYT